MAEREQHRIIAEAQAPGKLYIAGEYAVVEHGHPAILVAVNRMLTVRVTGHGENPGEGALSGDVPGNTPGESSAAASLPLDSRTAGSIRSQGHDEAATTWHRDAHGRCVPDESARGRRTLSLRFSASKSLHTLLALGRIFSICDVASDLDDASGRKYGIGSSAAVTVAGDARLVALSTDLSSAPMAQYKLAFAIARRAGNVGSGGDLAASLFGGCIRFCSPDRDLGRPCGWTIRRCPNLSACRGPI
jgi:isopentenyl-diphosphate delta-isomerase